MDLTQILHAFAENDQFRAVAVLIALDIVLGIVAAAADKTQEFSLTFVGNFLRNDVLGKVVPWFALYAAAKASGSADVVAGVDLGTVADAAFVFTTAALVGSLVTSLGDLGVPLPEPLTRSRGAASPPE